MSRQLSIIYCLSILVFLFSCGEDDGSSTSTSGDDPSNLSVEWIASQDIDGAVEVRATANNVVSYEFDAGDGSTLVSNTSGNFTHTYETSGSFQAVVKAIGLSGRFLQESNSFDIVIGDSSIPDYEGFELIWNDEFNSSSLNTALWNFEIGDGCPNLCGWGNNELQYYRQENTTVTGGNLVITAREENFQNRAYTSSRLTTQNKFDFAFGRVDISAKLPMGQGIWPALWMLGSNISSVGWPRSGEIDIMEMIGGNASGRDNTTHGTIHWDNQGQVSNGGSRVLPNGIFNDNFHLFSIIWNETEIVWLLDNEEYFSADIRSAEMSELQNEFFFIFNIAVGGNWPGNPNAETTFPQQMQVDYIRVYQEL